MLQLLKAGYDNVIAAVASYSDPETTVRTAEDLGYRVANFLAMGLDFGPYSNEPKVRRPHPPAVREGRGWAGDDGYMVAVALFTRNPDVPGDRADQLLRRPRRSTVVERSAAAWRSPPGRTAAGERPRRPCRSSSAVSSRPPDPVEHPVAGQLQQRGVEAEDGVRGQPRLDLPGGARRSPRR